MVTYTGEATYSNIQTTYFAFDADDAEDFEQKVIESVKEEFPDAYNIEVNDIKEVV